MLNTSTSENVFVMRSPRASAYDWWQEGGRNANFSKINNNLEFQMAMLSEESKSHLFPFSLHNLQLFKELSVNFQDFSHTARELACLDMILVKYIIPYGFV